MHRYEGASHLVPEDAPRLRRRRRAAGSRDLDAASGRRRRDPPDAAPSGDPPALVGADRQRAGDDSPRPSSRWAARTVSCRSPCSTAGCATSPPGWPRPGSGPATGSRCSSPPAADLTAAVYAVLAGRRGGRRRRRGPRPARGMRPGPAQRRSTTSSASRPGLRRRPADAAARPPDRRRPAGRGHARRALGAGTASADLARLGRGRAAARAAAGRRRRLRAWSSPPARPGPPRASSTATGRCRPSSSCCARRYGLTADDRLVAAFAPFALYGPALGIASAVPDIDVTAPGTLTAAALADAAAAVDAHRGVRLPGGAAQRRRHRRPASPPTQRAALGAGAAADVRRRARSRLPLLRAAAARCCPHADAHTPYGMTEALPVTDVSLEPSSRRAGPGRRASASAGRCRGRRWRSARCGRRRRRRPTPDHRPDVTGEICVRAAARQGPLRPALGHRARERRATPAGTAPATSGTSTTRAGCGSRAGWCTS